MELPSLDENEIGTEGEDQHQWSSNSSSSSKVNKTVQLTITRAIVKITPFPRDSIKHKHLVETVYQHNNFVALNCKFLRIFTKSSILLKI